VREGSEVEVVGGGLLGKFDNQCDISWAPDGKKLAFTRNGFVYSVTADGRRERRLARGLAPSWSPDGNHIAFIRNGTIYVLDVQRHEERRVARADELSWSPDGKALVVAHAIKPPAQDDQGGYEPGQYVIETIDASNGHVRKIWPENLAEGRNVRLRLAAGLAAALAVDAVDDAAAGNSVLVTASLLFSGRRGYSRPRAAARCAHSA